MDKKEKQRLKMFRLETKNDFIVYLNQIIVRVDKCLTKHKKILDELDKTINDNTDDKFEYEVYSEYLERLSSVESYSLNLLGDSQKVALSYFKFRTIIKQRKKKGTLGFEIQDLSSEHEKILSEFNQMRNWGNHVPESLITGELKCIEEGKFGAFTTNPIIVNYYKYVSREYMEDLYNTAKEERKLVRKIHQRMKKDYSFLIGESVEIRRVYHETPMDFKLQEATKLSAEIQGLKNDT